jgi:thiol:disulfide interchange protein
VAFLDRAESGGEVEDGSLARTLRERGVWVAVLLILAAGLALNLTPCVLPMIPINLAIIGAGAQAGSRTRGLGLGAAYGAAIALVYGALGLAVVLAGVRFGALNASPWFNLAIAALFLTMALAMLGVINIDFSRFQSAGAPARRGGFATAFCMGAVAALLAGACVAPVVISVLLLAADLYARGARSGLLLPFVLGLGMALPWPFAGAGLSFLPRPGRWMEAVKIGFGVLILLFALWYGRQGFNLLWERRQTSSPRIEAARMEQIEQGGWLTSLSTAVDQATRTGRPVLIDFWASWCKNCLYMDKTTFQDPVVTNRLAGFVKVKVRAEDMQDPATRALLDRFGVIGLPTYVVLTALPAAP